MDPSVSRLLAGLAPTTDDDEDAVRAIVFAGLGIDAKPARLGRYRVGAVLGRGGSGTVYEAFDEELERPVAIKVTSARPTVGEDPDTAQRRLLREARAAAQFQHPNVVSIYDVGRYGAEEAEGLPGNIAARGVYLVMEKVEGTDLRRWLERPRGHAKTLEVLVAAGEGLSAAHEAELVHRDFKPGNVLVGDGIVKVADFGLARRLPDPIAETEVHGDPAHLSTVTRAGAIAGTLPYMAPEQYAGRHGPAADQFAFCVTAYEALAGERPFPDDPGEGHAAKAAAAVPRSPRIPAGVHAVLVRGLAPTPEDRYPSMDELLRALQRPRGSRRRWPWIAAVGGVVVAGLAWDATRRPPCQPPAFVPPALERLAEGSEPGVARRLRGEAQALRDAWARGCDAQTGEVAHQDCLVERTEERQRLVELVDEGVLDPELVAEALARLPAAGRCFGESSSEQMSAGTASDPASARRLRARLTGASALADVGLGEHAATEIEAVRTAAEALDHRQLLVAAAAAQGHLDLQTNRFDEARERLESVYWEANELDDSMLMGRTAAELAFIHGRHLRDFEAARRWERHADAALERRGRPPWEQGGLYNVQAANRLAAGELDEAARLFEEAIARLEVAEGDRDLEVAVAATNLGEAFSRLGRQDEAERALERAAAIRREHYGPDHVSQLGNLVHLAKVRERQGRAAEAIEMLMRARSLMERDDPGGHPWRPAVLTVLGAALGGEERFPEAIEAFSAAIEQMDRDGRRDAKWAKLHKNLALAHEKLGDERQAEEHYQAALSGLEPGDPLRAPALLQVADFERGRGNLSRARALADDAAAELDQAQPPPQALRRRLEQLRERLDEDEASGGTGAAQ